MTTTTPIPQSRPARAAMLIQWAEQDPDWHTPDLLRELVALVRDVIPADALAIGAMSNLAALLDLNPDTDPELVEAYARRTLAPIVAGGTAAADLP